MLPANIKFQPNLPNIAADTVAFTESANKFSQSLRGLITDVGYNIGQVERLLGCINRYHCVF